MVPAGTLPSAEVNYLIYRYLLESGLQHTLFAFRHETQLTEKLLEEYRAMAVDPGRLVTLLNYARQLLHVDSHMDESGNERECSAPMSLLGPHTCSAPTVGKNPNSSKLHKNLVESLHILPSGRRRHVENAADGHLRDSAFETDRAGNGKYSSISAFRSISSLSANIAATITTPTMSSSSSLSSSASSSSFSATSTSQSFAKLRNNFSRAIDRECRNCEPMDVDGFHENGKALSDEPNLADDAVIEVLINGQTKIIALEADPLITLYSSTERYYQVFWNPIDDTVLATASLDAVVSLWSIPATNGKPLDVMPIRHPLSVCDNEITCIAWSNTGDYLATGSKNGSVRVFTKKGILHQEYSHTENSSISSASNLNSTSTLSSTSGSTLTKSSSSSSLLSSSTLFSAPLSSSIAKVIRSGTHAATATNPIFALRFSPDSEYLASGSASGSIIVWDLQSNARRHKYSPQAGAVMALEWTGERSLASASTDSTLVHTNFNKMEHQYWREHTALVNDLKCDPHRKFLATCSDDTTVRIWNPDKPKSVTTLRGHEKSVLVVDWNPRSQNKSTQIASVGQDSTIRIWDISSGSCLHCMSRYVGIHSVLSYSPDGRHIACGSDDQYIYVWTSSGQLVKTFYAHGSILDLRYNRSGDRIALCFGTPRVAILPFSV